MGAIGLADSYWHLLALAAVAGIGHTVYHPADYAILNSVVSERRLGRAFGIHSFTGYLGFALAPLFMTGIATLWNWQTAFIAAGAVGLFAALLVWANRGLFESELDGVSTGSGGGKKETAPPLGLAEGVRLLFSVPIMLCFMYFVLHQMGVGGLRSFLEVALSDLYATPQVISGAALTGLMAGAAGGILSGGFLADRTGPQIWVACLTLIPSGLLIAAIGLYDLPSIMLLVVITLAGFLMGLLVPSRDLLLRSVTPDGSMGKVMGFVSTGSNFGGALIPLVMGWVLDNSDPRFVFWISASMIAGALFTFATVKTKGVSVR